MPRIYVLPASVLINIEPHLFIRLLGVGWDVTYQMSYTTKGQDQFTVVKDLPPPSRYEFSPGDM